MIIYNVNYHTRSNQFQQNNRGNNAPRCRVDSLPVVRYGNAEASPYRGKGFRAPTAAHPRQDSLGPLAAAPAGDPHLHPALLSKALQMGGGGESLVTQSGNFLPGVALQDKLLAVYAAGSTMPIPVLRASDMAPLALVGSFGEGGPSPDLGALEAVQELFRGAGPPDGFSRQKRRAPGAAEMPLPPSVYQRLASSTTLPNIARALAYHKKCLEEMPLQGAQVAEEQSVVNNLSDTLRTILHL